MHNTETQLDHDELDLLLPWYVNGTLDEDESRCVERHIAGCTECGSNVELLNRMLDVAETDSLSAIVPKPRIGELLDTIGREQQAKALRKRYSSIAVAAVVAATVIGAIFVAFNRVPFPQQPQVFVTATTPGTAVPIDYIFLVEFEIGTSVAARRQFMDEIGGTELGPGDGPATFRVSAAIPAATAEVLNLYVKEMAARDEVRAVQLIAVQLPVR